MRFVFMFFVLFLSWRFYFVALLFMSPCFAYRPDQGRQFGLVAHEKMRIVRIIPMRNKEQKEMQSHAALVAIRIESFASDSDGKRRSSKGATQAQHGRSARNSFTNKSSFAFRSNFRCGPLQRSSAAHRIASEDEAVC